MATPKDKLRCKLARIWINEVGGIAEAAEITGVNPRTLQRIFGGKQPPPPRLLEEMAGWIDVGDTTAMLPPNMKQLAIDLRAAAQPAEVGADA
ncbi:hypothetical protein S2M10_29730 [Sphingomonas sp. S2M10]|uniref:helix-turn-helix domain-containing protein n=1 Tax=Sphingomonas sp. S2M10 TaxID=2705010 RepID=UPI001456AF16|nr:helix-turn-helix transcriptional regulator [Sphingomonas sp. S2M10]NLS27971.1 hypothetical protein [Sphingomonas sp. S2M10]